MRGRSLREQREQSVGRIEHLHSHSVCLDGFAFAVCGGVEMSAVQRVVGLVHQQELCVSSLIGGDTRECGQLA